MSNLGVTKGEIAVMMSGLILEKSTKASMGKYIESSGVWSIILMTGSTTRFKFSKFEPMSSVLSFLANFRSVLSAIS